MDKNGKRHQWRSGRNPVAYRQGYKKALKTAVAASCLQLLMSPTAWAFEFDTGDSDLRMRWDNTVKYSTGFRLKDPSNALTTAAGSNFDDGNRNFKKGLVSNRADVLSEFDLTYQKFGFRVSGAAWYDTVYNRSNDNNSPGTINQSSAAYNHFTNDTRDLMGRKGEFLDAFVHGKFDIADKPVSFRLGRHTVLYGETLFFGGNGISGGQAPVDVIKLLSVPGTQFKELLMPVNQLSAQVQLSPNVTVGGYYQFEWRANRIPPVGSYLSNADVIGAGAERLFFGPGVWVDRANDVKGKSSGQGGMQIRFRPDSEFAEFGLYAIRYHAKDFQLTYNVTGNPANPGSMGSYQMAYGNNIDAYGASMSTTVGDANVAAEVSLRRNAPLTSALSYSVPGVNNNSGNPSYAVGNTAHANLSMINLLSRSAIWDGGSVLAEVAWNRRLSITKNPDSLDPGVTRDATAMRVLFAPEYYQVVSGLDVTVPVGLGYVLSGRSSSSSVFGGGAEHGGDFSIGAKFDYRKKVIFGINYVKFLGKAGPYQSMDGAGPVQYKQSLKDRDFISLSMQATF